MNSILERDGYKCQNCGRTDMLVIHHKKPVVDGGDNSPDNLITLCRVCHPRLERLIKAETRLTCHNCNFTWMYSGKAPYYATCTRCLRKVKIPQQGEKKKA